MNKIFNYICLASVLSLSTACQDDELATKDNSNGLFFSVSFASDSQSNNNTRSAVKFTDEDGKPTPFDITLSVEDSYVEPTLTRGTPINTLSDFTSKVEEFRAWGWYGNANGSIWSNINTSNATGTIIKKYAGADYRPTDGSGNFIEAYYPDNANYNTPGNYHFYAIAPSNLSEIGISNQSRGYASCTFDYTSPGNSSNTNTDDAELQKEVLVGYLKEGATRTSVPMTFEPLLAAIQFKVSPDKVGRSVTIDKIELRQFLSQGRFTLSSTGVEWSTANATKPRNPQNFTQEFNFTIDPGKEGQDINNAELSKTFFVIPQIGSASTTNGTQIIVHYTDNGVKKQGRHLLYGQQFEAGKTYIYNIGNFEKTGGKLEPWVDFAYFEVNADALLGGTNEIHEENNNFFKFDFLQDFGTYEKAYFTIHNLEAEHWYIINFSEKITLYEDGVKNETSPFGDVGSYACRVSQSKMTGTNQGSMLPFYENSNASNANPPFIWQHPANIYDRVDNYTPQTTKLTFKATAEDMIWNWDYSKGADTRGGVRRILKAEIYLVGEKIKDITPESGVPTVDFLNATLYNTAHTNNNQGVSSHKTYAVDATAGTDPAEGTLYFRVKSSGSTARMNIPLTNLTQNRKYRITYKLDKTGTVASDDNHIGCVVQASPNTGTTAFSTSSPYIDYTSSTYSAYSCRAAEFSIDGSASGMTGGETIEFTASTTGTMYWVWDFSAFKDGNYDHQFLTFKNVTIEDITP